MKVSTNIKSFEQALRDNFKSVKNKKYIAESIAWHYHHGYITNAQAIKLEDDFLGGAKG